MILLCAFLLMQPGPFSLPKYPPRLKMTSRDYGPRPGAAVSKNGKKSAIFRRVYSRPAGLRLLVKTNCTNTPKKDDLTRRAERISLSDGPPVQIDLAPGKDGKAAYFAVMYLERKISHVDLVARDGKYAVSNTRASDEGTWVVKKLNFPKQGGSCTQTRELTNREMRVALVNALNDATLAHFRTNPG